MGYLSFLNIEGIRGGCTDEFHPGWIDLTSFSQSLAGSDGPVHHDISVAKLADRSSPDLAGAVCSGRHFSRVVIQLCPEGEPGRPFMELRLADVTLQSYCLSGGPQMPESAPFENFNLRAARVEWRYLPGALGLQDEEEPEICRAEWSGSAPSK